MQFFILNPRSTRRLDSPNYLFLRLPTRPFLGLVGEVASTTIVFTPALWRSWHLLIVFFIVLQGVLQTPWTFDKKLEDSALFLRVLVLVLSVQFFLEEDPKLLEKF